jgi:V/A-type H+-transporting ATPase subunit K
MTIAAVYAFLGVAISVALGAAGSSMGSGAVAKASAGLLSKEPEKFAQTLILSALPSTQALYGLLFGFIILIRTGLIGGELDPNVGIEEGMAFAFAAVPVGVACLFSGIYQGQVAASSVKILAQKPENATQGIILASLVESFAIFGLVISLLIAFVGIDF